MMNNDWLKNLKINEAYLFNETNINKCKQNKREVKWMWVISFLIEYDEQCFSITMLSIIISWHTSSALKSSYTNQSNLLSVWSSNHYDRKEDEISWKSIEISSENDAEMILKRSFLWANLRSLINIEVLKSIFLMLMLDLK